MSPASSFLMIQFLLLFSTILLLVLLLMITKQQWKSRRKHKLANKLPPGSLGLPVVGETLELFSRSPQEFFDTRQNRYGEIFKTNILGCNCVMVASPESVGFVLVTKANLFRPTYPKGKMRLIGPSAIFFQQGTYHTQIRKLVIQSSFYLSSIKPLIPKIEAIAISTLNSWCGGHHVHTFHELKKFAFDVAALTIFGVLNDERKQDLKRNYCILDKGYNSFPVGIPGTPYYRSLLARRRLGHLIEEIIKERRERRLTPMNLLDHFLNFKDENGTTLTDNQISDNIIGVLFAAQDTTASLLTWIIKYVSHDNKLLEAIKEEQRAVFISNDQGRLPLTWDQTREMSITHKVILESLRMASIIAFTYREATQDVVYDGYLIPKGWKVLPLFRSIHHNPSFFPNPHTFDPSRYEVGTKAHTFMPFGYGAHSCPGNELAKLEMFVFIYHLVNNFRWDLVGPSTRVQYSPFPIPENGLSAKFWKTSCGPGEQVCR